jgi:2-methylisocitrate lyase-like PEP mutase family enzyme
MKQTEKAKRFAELHVRGTPLVLYNAWDAGSAKSILNAGAKAIATSSWAVAEAQGRDGEAISIEFAEQIIARIAATIDVPVTVDFEGYSERRRLANNITRLLDLGVIGINFEDRSSRVPGVRHQSASAVSQPSVRRRNRKASGSLSTRGPTCFSARMAIQHGLWVKLWTGPRRRPPALAFSRPAR